MNTTDSPSGHVLPGIVYIILSFVYVLFLLKPLWVFARKLVGVLIILISIGVVVGYGIHEGWSNPHRAVEASLVPLGIALIFDEGASGALWRAGLFASSAYSYLFYITHDHGDDADMDMDTPEDKFHYATALIWGLAALFALLSLWPGLALQVDPKEDSKSLRRVRTSLFVLVTLGASAMLWLLEGTWSVIGGVCLYSSDPNACGGSGDNWTGVYLAFQWLLLSGLVAYFTVIGIGLYLN